MARSMAQSKGPEAVRAATGRDHEGWRALLLDAGAKAWPHARIARWLVEEQGVDGWWAQGIAIDFEQAHQGRVPGQRTDGTFATSRTRTFPGDRLEALARVRAAIEAQHGEAHGANLAASQPNVRWRLADGTRLAIAAQAPNASGTPVAATLERLPSQAALEPARAALDALLDAAG